MFEPVKGNNRRGTFQICCFDLLRRPCQVGRRGAWRLELLQNRRIESLTLGRIDGKATRDRHPRQTQLCGHDVEEQLGRSSAAAVGCAEKEDSLTQWLRLGFAHTAT